MTRAALGLVCFSALSCTEHVPSSEAEPESRLDRDVPILDPGVPFPERLSETALYPLDGDPSRPNAHALPYGPRSELWSNGLAKARLLVLPEGPRIDTSRVPWRFPRGTLFVKTFSDETGPVETRILRQTGEEFEYAVYHWSANREAELLDGRLNVELVVRTEAGNTPHTIPSRLTCRQCHESSDSQILGFAPLQLWSADLPRAVEDAFTEPPELTDPIATTDATGRAVLDYFVGNCVHCHNASIGLASSFDLRPDVAFANVIDEPTDSNATAAGIRVVKGSPEESILFRAVSAEGDIRDVKDMPPEGVQVRDSAAIELLRAWILGLD